MRVPLLHPFVVVALDLRRTHGATRRQDEFTETISRIVADRQTPRRPGPSG
jgi:hypothetical protein